MSVRIPTKGAHVKSVARRFLSVHWDHKGPLLIGYSGGPDSKALLYALLEYKPHIAHVDHGWREESFAEAERIREEAAKLGLVAHIAHLKVEKSEDAARRARLDYFRSLGYGHVLLAHQADDLAETALKRILEGARIAHSAGMQPVSQNEGLTILRPLLDITRREILEFLEQEELSWIVDSSNVDPKYLRARMRGEIFPFLEEKFGKRVAGNLALFAKRAAALEAHLDQRVAHVQEVDGKYDLRGLDRVEQAHFLHKLTIQKKIFLSREEEEAILDGKSGIFNLQIY